MQIILIQKVDKLGMPGDVKNVSDGYATNFLFPKKLARQATAQAIKESIDQKKKQTNLQNKNSVLIEHHQNIIKDKTINLLVKSSAKGHLFAAVTAGQIASEINQRFKIDVQTKDIKIDKPLKTTGVYNLQYSPAKELSVEFTVVIKPIT
jgi:large subunit ribosomal protein L9